MRVRVTPVRPGEPLSILEVGDSKFFVDTQATAALYAHPHVQPRDPAQDEERLQLAQRIFPPAIIEVLPGLGLRLGIVLEYFGWPACAWFVFTERSHQDHIIAIHLVGQPTEATNARSDGEAKVHIENPFGAKPIELSIGPAKHPDRQHMLTMWVRIAGVPLDADP